MLSDVVIMGLFGGMGAALGVLWRRVTLLQARVNKQNLKEAEHTVEKGRMEARIERLEWRVRFWRFVAEWFQQGYGDLGGKGSPPPYDEPDPGKPVTT